MPTFQAKISGFVVGDDLELYRTITAIPSGQILQTAWFTVKKTFAATYTNALIRKRITNTQSLSSGWIEDTGSTSLVGILRFYLSPEDTLTLHPQSEYPYDIQIALDNGDIYTPETGVIVALPQVTDTIE